MDDLIYYYPHGHEAHYSSGHPERPDRVNTVRQAIDDAGWWNGFSKIAPLILSKDIYEAVHTPDYLDTLEKACREERWLDVDTYTKPESWQLALNAAGGSAAMAAAVWTGVARRGFALSRPPGHHACKGRGMGFCLMNNMALAAQYLVRELGAKRLAIIDLDLHHGNGTQDIFWKRSDVFFISVHQSPLYPGTGNLEDIGEANGWGCTANIPLPPASGDEAYQTIMEELIIPLLERYSPEMVMISLGYDAHWCDPLGHLRLSAAGYNHILTQVLEWIDRNCQSRVGIILEGGYDLRAAAACAQATVAALLNKEWVDPIGPTPRPEGYSWQAVLRRAHDLWKV